MKYKNNNGVVYSCKYHVVWCPKYRRNVLVDDIARRLKELIIQRCSEINAEIIELEIAPNYVRLLIEIDPQFGINKAIRSIKGTSSHALRTEFPSLKTRLPTLWTNNYFVSTDNEVPLEAITKYIESQLRSEQRRNHGKKL